MKKVIFLLVSFISVSRFQGQLIWQNDFSDPGSWVIGHDGVFNSDWEIGVGLESGGQYATPAIVSTTASNGYAMYNSDGFNNQTTIYEQVHITTASPIDLSGYSNVVLEFETQYRKYTDEQTFLLISTDGTFPVLDSPLVDLSTVAGVYHVWEENELTNSVSPGNPTTRMFNISDVAGNASQVWVRLQFVGIWGYAWYVDDVIIRDKPFGCTYPLACNFDALAEFDDGSCLWPGCTDPNAVNFDNYAECSNGNCIYETWGCTNSLADNYNPTAVIDDGSCYNFFGCKDYSSCNYNPSAWYADSSCIPSGCMDPLALNYNPMAGCDNGFCCYNDMGCTDAYACNYDACAIWDNSSCIYPMCSDSTACNYDLTAQCEGYCVYPGCTDYTACNFDYYAACDDGSCSYGGGCTDTAACNFDAAALCNNYNCYYGGCMDISACNYDAMAWCDNGYCVYPGCNDYTASNYNPFAGCFDGSCIYTSSVTFEVNMSDLVISPNGVHLAGNFQGWDPSATEMTDPDLDGIYSVIIEIPYFTEIQYKFINGNDWVSQEYVPSFNGDVGCGTPDGFAGYNRIDNINPLEAQLIGPYCFSSCSICNNNEVCQGAVPITCDSDVFGSTVNVANDNSSSGAVGCVYSLGSAGQRWYKISTPWDLTAVLTTVGITNYDPMIHVYTGSCGSLSCITSDDDAGAGVNSQVVFEMLPGIEYFVRVGGYGSSSGDFELDVYCISEVYPPSGCLEPNACNFDSSSVLNDNCIFPYCNDPSACWYDVNSLCSGPCYYPGCNDYLALNYDPNAGCSNDSCVYSDLGCTYLDACNFNTNAVIDDGSCVFPGCTDPDAMNYDPQAGCVDFGGSLFVSECFYGSLGCIDTSACNFSIEEYYNNSVCDYDCIVDSVGCTNAAACNFVPTAALDDGSCLFPGCTYLLACNYDMTAGCDDGSCSFPLIYLDCNGNCVNDFDFDGVCDEYESAGCSDGEACNYNPTLSDTVNELCVYSGCTNFFACNYNANAACNDGSCVFEGCMDSSACNYNPYSGCNDSAGCIYAGCNVLNACNYNPLAGCNLFDECVFPGCNDSLACNYDEFSGCNDGSCVMPGCTNENACNYDPIAGCDNNTCVFPGCTNSQACNYEAQAGCDDSTCTFPGCLDMLACNYQPEAGCDNNTCEFPGCLDSTKCNYNPFAACDNGSCIEFCCNDPAAINYLLPSFTDVDCSYSPEIVLFHDVNGNYIMDQDELGLPNRPVSIDIIGNNGNQTVTVYSNGSGHIEYLFSADEILTISLATTQDNLWSHIDDSFVSATINVFDSLYIPLQPIDTLAYDLTPFNGLSDYIDCSNGYHGGVIVNNYGGDTIVVNMTTDITELVNLGYQVSVLNQFETISTDQPNGQLAWNTVIYPGQIELLTFNLLGPGQLVENYQLQYSYNISNMSGTIMLSDSLIRELNVFCNEDDSDGALNADPPGIFQPNYVLAGDEIFYVIDFSFDGNPSRFDDCANDSVAYRVLVSDTVDAMSMEVGSIQPIANSHESVCTAWVEELPDGRAVVNFDFTGINLRADTVDGMANSGYAIVAVHLLDNLESGWEIENTASTQFFDSTGCNPDGVVMSYFHTIFGCDFNVPESLQLCEGPATSLNAGDPYADYYAWNAGQEIVLDSVYSFNGFTPGNYELELITGNALCSDTNQLSVTLNALPQITSVPSDTSVCSGDGLTLLVESADPSNLIEWDNGIVNGEAFNPEVSTSVTYVVTDVINDSVSCSIAGTIIITLGELPTGVVTFDTTTYTYSAPNGVSWQWYLNDVAIEGAVAQTYIANPDVLGTYSVQVTSADGCSAIIIGVDESDLAGNVLVFPNPMSNETTLLLPAGVFDITLYDMSGRVVLKRLSCMQREILHRGSLSAGCYQLHIFNEKGSVVKKLVVE